MRVVVAALSCAIFASAFYQNSDLVSASGTGDLKTVQRLLGGGTDPNIKDIHGRTPLYAAIVAGHLDVVAELLRKRADVNVPVADITPLMAAADRGLAEAVNLLLKTGANPRATTKTGWTALHFAGQSGCEQCIAPLVKAGGDINARGQGEINGQAKDGVTPLSCAMYQRGSDGFVLSLVRNGADQNQLSLVAFDMITPLMWAAQNLRSDLLAALLAAGGNPNIADAKTPRSTLREPSGRTALFYVFDKSESNPQIDQNREAMLRSLLANGADVNARDKEGYSALMVAVSNGSPTSLSILLSAGADVNARSNNGTTALTEAAARGKVDATQVLLDHHANPTLRNEDGQTALGIAMSRVAFGDSFSRVAQKLKATGATLSDGDEKAILAEKASLASEQLGRAITLGNLELAKTLLADLADVNTPISRDGALPLSVACASGYSELVNALILRGADVNKTDNADRTPLMYAAIGGHQDLVSLLLSHGAEINRRSKDGITALRYAASFGRPRTASLLISAGADRQAISEALIGATSSGNIETMQALLDRGADVNVRGEKSVTPLMIAVSLSPLVLDVENYGNIRVRGGEFSAGGGVGQAVRLLLDKGASVNVADGEGATVLIWTASHIKTAGLDTLRIILDSHAEVNARGAAGQTALELATDRNAPEAVSLLLERGADANVRDNASKTPLIIAGSHGFADILSILLHSGVDIDHQDEDGDTALILAAAHNQLDAVRLLLKNGARSDLSARNGETALSLATKRNYDQIVLLLRNSRK